MPLLKDIDKRIQQRLEDPPHTLNPEAPGRFDADRRKRLRHFLDKELASDGLKQLFHEAEKAENRLLQAMKQGLHGADLNRYREHVRREVVEAVDRRNKVRLRSIAKQLDAEEKRYWERLDSDPSRSLLALRRYELDYADYDEKQAAAVVRRLEREGEYDSDQLRVLGSKGKDAMNRARDLRANLPAWAATPTAQGLIAEAEKLLSVPVGSMSYRIEGVDSEETINVLDVFNDGVTPSLSNFVPEPAGATE